jgi:1-deoxy-D-xylulose-5-phosphate reductoisomerase
MVAEKVQYVTILGATGSIGVNTLDVIARHPDRYRVFALTAREKIDELFQQIQQFHPRYAVLLDEKSAQNLQQRLKTIEHQTEILVGVDALIRVATHDDVNIVMAAIVGSAGLAPTLAAVKSGKKVLLANKESLVMAGGLFMQAVAESGAQLLPIDSEHNAMFQCLPADYSRGMASVGVRRILLTGSGGPFRTTPLHELDAVTPDQACAHPNWKMGRKISVDSATMMNKGLELIEACWLFNVKPQQIDIVLHPQSIIHSMVEYIDGSVLAQMGNPDMRTPIAYGLAWPERIDAGVSTLDLIAQARLDFAAPDEQRFPCLRLAREALRAGGTTMAALNAANEIAVQAFLDGQIAFTHISRVIEQVVASVAVKEPVNLAVVEAADAEAREKARRFIFDTHSF